MAYSGPEPLKIIAGGTSATTMTNTDGVVYYNGTGLVTTTVGTTGQVLTSNGTGVAPTFQTAGGGSSTSFSAFLNTSVANVTGDGTDYQVIFDTKFFDTASGYNTSTGLYTVPTTGNYLLTTYIGFNGLSGANTVGSVAFQTGSGGNYLVNVMNYANVNDSGQINITGSVIIPLTALDTVGVNVTVSNGTLIVGLTGVVFGGTNSTFSAVKI